MTSRLRLGVRLSRGRAAVVVAAILAVGGGPALAASDSAYPNRPIRIVVPYSPGGVSDTLARVIGERLEQAWGQPVIVENRPGASGNIASDQVAKAAADGYTLLLAGNSITILPSTAGARAVDPVRAFAPVLKLVAQPILIAVHPSLRADTLADLVALARASPGTIAYASPGIGTTDHLAAALLWTRAGVELIHVPYANSGQEIKDLVKGETPVAFITAGAVAPWLARGEVRALAVTTPQRIAAMPGVPTVAESGFPDFEVVSWYGLLAPAGTPAEIVDRLNREITRILEIPGLRERFAALGTLPAAGTPDQFAREISALVDAWAPIVKAAGIVPQ